MRLAQATRPRHGHSLRFARLRLERLDDRTVPAAIAWDGGPSGNGTNWLDAANWRDTSGIDVLPGAIDDVTLASTGTNPAIVVSGSTSVRSITSSRDIQITGGTLSVAATANKFAALLLDGGTLSPADGAFFTGGDIRGPGVFTQTAGRTLTVTNTDFTASVVNNGTLVTRGTVRFNGGVGSLAGSTLRVQGDAANGAANVIFPGGFTNNGSLELSSLLAANTATITVNGGSLTNAAAGTFSILAGAGGGRSVALANATAFNNQGTLNVNADFTVSQTGSATSSSSGTVNIDPAATFSVSGTGTTFNYQGGTVAGGGRLNFANGLQVGIAFGTVLTNSGAFTLSATNTTFNGPGSLANAVGATLNLRDDTINAPVQSNGTMIVRGTVAFNNGLFTTAGSTTRILGDSAVGTATMTIGIGGVNNAGAFEMTSTGTMLAASLTVSGGSFTNAVGGTFNVLAGTGGARTITLTNAQFVNQAVLNLTAASLTIPTNGTGKFTNAAGGNLDVGAGTTLTDSAGITNNALITGSGTITGSVSGTGTISPGPAFTPPATGQLTINGNLSLAGLPAQIFGTTAGSLFDQLVVNGTVSLSGPLNVGLGYTPAVGDVIRLIDNDGTDAVTGTFTGLAEGAKITIGGSQFTLSYAGGSGNDVTLSIPAPVATVTGVQVNGGAAQRSMVTSVNVTFNQVVNLPANIADAFTLANANPQVIASSGFNDASGLNGNPTANSPFNVNNNVSLNGQGVGEPGWLSPWSVGISGSTTLVNSGQFEGDGAVFMQTVPVNRILQLPMSGVTSVQIALKIPSAATSNNAFIMFIRQQANSAIGAQWQASGDGHFRVTDGHEDNTNNLLDTGILWTPGAYQTIRVDVNTVTRTWEFSVDGVKYNAPHPLRYRDAPTFLDKLELECDIGNPNGAYIDAITVTRSPTVTIGSATAATVGGVTVVTLTGFTGPQTNAGSLIDGTYALMALANQITNSTGQQLDGNRDGTAGDNFIFADNSQPSGLFRLFGDANGDRVVNGADVSLFVPAFGGNNSTFDFNGDGVVNGADLTEFVKRFGQGI